MRTSLSKAVYGTSVDKQTEEPRVVGSIPPLTTILPCHASCRRRAKIFLGPPVASGVVPVPSKPPAEIQNLIECHIKGFNSQDNDLFLSVFGDTAIIIDGIAPYRWMNPNGPAKWLADVEKWRADLGVTHEHLSYEMGFWNVEGTAAYAVLDGTLTVTMKGQSVVRKGTLAYTFANRSGVWKIEAQAWGRTA